jgi:O-antigen ligase
VHDAATAARDQPHKVEGAVGPVLAFIAIVAFLMGPRGAPGEIVVLSLAPIAALAVQARLGEALRPSPLLLACAVFGLYIAINAAWAVDRVEAYGKVLFFLFTVAIVQLALTGIARLGETALLRIQRAILTAALAGSGFLLIEILTDQGLKRLFFSLVALARPDPKHIQVVDGWVTQVNAYMLNRNMAALCLALWPAFLIARTLFPTQKAKFLCAALLVMAGVSILGSEHETSMLALVLAVLAFLGMSLAPALLRKLLTVGWVLAALLVVPIALLAYAEQLHFADWIPKTGRNRIILWAYTANAISEAPVLGVGVASTRELDEARAPIAEKPAGHTYALRTGRHAHNIFMQTWYELGAVGAVLLCAIGLVGIRLLSTLPQSDQPLAFASFVSAMIIGGFSWGMWQTWFIASFGIWAILLAIALEGARRAAIAPAGDSLS